MMCKEFGCPANQERALSMDQFSSKRSSFTGADSNKRVCGQLLTVSRLEFCGNRHAVAFTSVYSALVRVVTSNAN